MPFTIVLDGPASSPARVAGGVGLTLGGVLVGVGVIAAIPAFLLSLALVLVVFSPLLGGGSAAGSDGLTGRLVLGWLVSLTVAIAASVVGVRLVRGRRRLVLFLRRFGHTEATDVLTSATASIGGRWRLVTLDDREVTPVGVGTASRGVLGVGRLWESLSSTTGRLGTLARVVFALCVVGAVGSAVLVLRSNGGDVTELLDWSPPADSAALLAFRIFTSALGAALAILLVGGLVLLVVMLVLAPVFGAASMAAGAMREAEQAKAITIDDSVAIEAARERIREISRRVFSPRLVVLTVHSSVWQETVRAFAAVSAVLLIDISEPTEHVVWELEQLLARFGRRCVVVGQYERLGRLFDPAPAGSAIARTQRLLDGREVLAYRADPAGRRRFTRALLAMLDHAVRE